jgi:hypothetical protein
LAPQLETISNTPYELILAVGEGQARGKSARRPRICESLPPFPISAFFLVLAGRRFSLHFVGWMKTILGASFFCLVAAMFCGCSSHHAGPVYHAGDEKPPLFLSGPVGAVLTNFNGFGARVSATLSSQPGESKIVAGELLGREGLLIFQPSLGIKGKRARTEGGLFFIWDERKHSGYVLSEALQAYAPVQSAAATTGPIHIANDGIQAEVDGHPCHRSETALDLSDGQKARLTVWRADDERHFPLKIEVVNGAERVTVSFSEVRRELPALDLFRPPDGFAVYPTSVALMNELIVRDASLIKRNQTEDLSEPADVRSQAWHQLPVAQ